MSRRRVFVISDLHLGGDAPRMMSRPGRLASFIESLPRRLEPGESLELVIAGDFVDFLAIKPNAAWTPDPAQACEKLASVVEHQPFSVVFDALRGFVGGGHELTVLVGNHDVEFGLPAVQDSLEATLRRRIRFVDDGRAHRVGRLLIEHGNRYDPPNENDWGALRAIRSAQSRFEKAEHPLDVSSGSNLVDKVLNNYKGAYPFLDLLQPQNELLLYLLLALEPGLRTEVRQLAQVWKAKRLADSATGKANPALRKVGSRSGPTAEPASSLLAAAFPELHQALRPATDRPVAAREWLTALFRPAEDGLAAVIRSGKNPDADSLNKFRVVAREALVGDTSAVEGSADDSLAIAAANILAQANGAVQTVIMGHTHVPRELSPRRDAKSLPKEWRERVEAAQQRKAFETALYINTGTWADRIRIDLERIDSDEYLAGFLNDLVRDRRSPLVAHYADCVVSTDGNVERAALGVDR